MYRRSLSSGPNLKNAEAFFSIETRKDSAVHVSLSSSLLIKQPGASRSIPLNAQEQNFQDPQTPSEQPITVGCLCTLTNEELIDTSTCGAGCWWPPPRRWPGYRPHLPDCQRPFSKNCRLISQPGHKQEKPIYFRPIAALGPHSCDVLCRVKRDYAEESPKIISVAGTGFPAILIWNGTDGSQRRALRG